MSYNLLKSLSILLDKKDKNNIEFVSELDFTTKGCIFSCGGEKDGSGRYKVYLDYIYPPDAKIESAEGEHSRKITNINLILNNSLKCGVARFEASVLNQTAFSLLETFDNVIRRGNCFYIFPIDDFSIKLSRELYSVSTDKSVERLMRMHGCRKLNDFGVVLYDEDTTLSVIEIALRLIKGEDIVYNDGLVYKNGKYSDYYKIMLTDKGKAMITRYKMAKGL